MLLFQWRVMVGGDPGSHRLCEQRIINFRSRDDASALVEAKKRGRSACFRYRNSDGNPVHFEFVGVLDLLDLGAECSPDEVWYDIVQLIKPMERRKELLMSFGGRRANKPLKPAATRRSVRATNRSTRRR